MKLLFQNTSYNETIVKLSQIIAFYKANVKSGIFPLRFHNILFKEDAIYFFGGPTDLKIEVNDGDKFTPFSSDFEFQDVKTFLILLESRTETIDQNETTFR
jgi:hypothetical protein